jgi:hypothetical protein
MAILMRRPASRRAAALFFAQPGFLPNRVFRPTGFFAQPGFSPNRVIVQPDVRPSGFFIQPGFSPALMHVFATATGPEP